MLGDEDRPFLPLLCGYRGPYELEIVGPRIEAEGYASAVRRSVEHVDALLRRVGAAA